MSRIGKKPIEIPAKVKVSVNADRQVSVEGPKGTLTMTHRPEVQVNVDESAKSVTVVIDEADATNRPIRAHWGTTRALIQNMILGVVNGYEKTLEISGVGWQAAVQGQQLKLQVGLANALFVDIPQGLEVNVEKGQTVKIAGADKQLVGNFAAGVRNRRKPEPYNGKGIKYAGEVIRRKAGKAFGA